MGHAFACIDFGRQGGGVGKLKRNVAFPLRLERGNVNDDAAACVGGFAQADGQDVARDAEIFDCARQGKGVGWNDAAVVFDGYEVFRVEIFRVDDGAVDIGEDFEFIGTTDVVAVAGCAVGMMRWPLASLIWLGSNGSIMPCSSAMRRIHLSDLMLMVVVLG